MKKTILLLVLLLIPISFSESLLDDVLIAFPTSLIAGSPEAINVTFTNTQSDPLSFYFDITLTSSNVPPLNLGEITVEGCDETAVGHFICENIADPGFNSFNYILTTLPNLYPGDYVFSGFLAIEHEDQEPVIRYIYKYKYRQRSANETGEMIVKEIVKEVPVYEECGSVQPIKLEKDWLIVTIVGFCSLLIGILGLLLFLHYKNKYRLKDDDLPKNVPKNIYTTLPPIIISWASPGFFLLLSE